MDHDHDAVLAAALALIDEVYGSARARGHNLRQRDEITRLRHTVDLSYRVASKLTSRIASLSCSSQFLSARLADATCDLAASRSSAFSRIARWRSSRWPLAICAQTCAMCEPSPYKSRWVWSSAEMRPSTSRRGSEWQQPTDIERCRVLERSLMPGILLQQLDKMCYEWNPWWATPRPAIGVHRRERRAFYSDSGDALQLQFMFAGHYPFKLSVVAKELWGVVIEDALGAEILEPHVNEVCGHVSIQRLKSFGRFAVYGPTMVRRCYTKDGGVMICWSSVTSPIPDGDVNSPNLMADLETIESGCVRLTRVMSSNHKQLVYVETSTQIHVAPKAIAQETSLRLRQLEEFMLRLSKEEGDFNRQKVENRLLDAAMADCRRSMF